MSISPPGVIQRIGLSSDKFVTYKKDGREAVFFFIDPLDNTALLRICLLMMSH